MRSKIEKSIPEKICCVNGLIMWIFCIMSLKWLWQSRFLINPKIEYQSDMQCSKHFIDSLCSLIFEILDILCLCVIWVVDCICWSASKLMRIFGIKSYTAYTRKVVHSSLFCDHILKFGCLCCPWLRETIILHPNQSWN